MNKPSRHNISSIHRAVSLIDLTAGQRRTVLALLSRHLPNTTVWAYGSRVKWTSHPASDLDLVAFAEPEQAARVAELREAFDESNLPFRVDLFVWDDVPRDFRKRIETEHVMLAEKERRLCKDYKEWPMVALGDCIEINAAVYSPRERWPFVNYLDTGSITENRIGEIQHLISGEDKIPSRARRKARSGDMLYSTVRPNQRHFGLLKKVPENFLASTGFSVIRGREDCARTDFIYRFLAQDSVVEHLQTIAEHSTSAYPSIRPADIERLMLHLPPLPEQHAIAHILGAFDDKIELNRRMGETLEEAVRALFKAWFANSSELGAKQDAHPLHGDLNEYASLNPESWSATNRPRSVAYVDLSNTKWGAIEKIETYEWSDAPGRARRVVRPGDTIVGTVRPGNGSFALIGKEGLTASTGFAVLRPKESFDAQFVWCAATSKDNIERLAHLADGGAYPAVPAETVAATPVVLADVSARRKFSDATAPLVARYLASGDESRTLADLRDALLPKLLSGEIRIQDAEKVAEAAT